MEMVASYSIDAATNRLNRINPVTQTSLYAYDAAGNLVSSDTSMGTGTSSIGGHTFTYNASSQITAVDNGSTATYLYNGIGERTNKATPSGWTAYIYLNGQPMSENSIINGTGDWTDYIYANGQKIARVTTPIYGGASTTNYYLNDHLGTTQVELDASGNVTWQGQFTPFGTELPDGSTSMHYKFTGKERDTESGLDFFGARFYGSAMGRWMSPDWAEKPEAVPYSSLSNPQSLNLYGYVGNNPLSQIDVDGHEWKLLQKILNAIDGDGFVTDKELATQHRTWLKDHWNGNSKNMSDDDVNKAYGCLHDNAGGCRDAYNKAQSKKAAELAIAVMGLVPGAKMEDHHLLPRQFEDYFNSKGLDIEDYTTEMSTADHRLKPNGVHAQGSEGWNQRWGEWIKNNPGASREQVLQQMNKMKSDFGIK